MPTLEKKLEKYRNAEIFGKVPKYGILVPADRLKQLYLF